MKTFLTLWFKDGGAYLQDYTPDQHSCAVSVSQSAASPHRGSGPFDIET